MKQGDVYFANLNPTKGREQQGIRPIVIISGNAMNDHSDMVIICPLSSKIKSYAGCITLKKDKVNNLQVDSEVITFQVRAISKERLNNKVGKVTIDQIKQIIIGLNGALTY